MVDRKLRLWDLVEKFSWIIILVGLVVWVPVVTEQVRHSRYDVGEFFRVNEIYIGDTTVGQSPPMSVDRMILQPFRGTYHVELRSFPERTVVCTASATIEYNPAATLPADLDLDWWTGSPDCSATLLRPGEYIVVTSWEIDNDVKGLDPQVVKRTSNSFRVEESTLGQAQQQIQMLEQQIEELKMDVERK